MLIKTKEEFKLYYNHQRIPALEIRVGDQIWVDMSDIQWLGPFKVVKVVRKGAHKLELPPGIPSYIR
jgi:hypothetical protein